MFDWVDLVAYSSPLVQPVRIPVPNLPNAPLCKRGRARNKGDP